MKLLLCFLTVYTVSLSVNCFTDVCYGDLGCFTDRPPYGGTPIRQKGFPPQSPSKVNTTFDLYTRNGSVKFFTSNEIPSLFNPTRPSRFIIHGFIHNRQKPWLNELKDALLKAEDLNVVIVDWKSGADFPYAQAASNTQVVGAEIAKLIKSLIEQTGANISDFHLIGHSLGAHVAGYAGERLDDLGRITGLDPAGPLFEFTDERVRLDQSDAKFVDVIHTDGASILQVGLGLLQPSGHVDFYPNGGRFQPKCAATSYKILSAVFHFATANFDALDNQSGCSHVAAIKFFQDSIRNKKCYTAYPCDSKNDFDNGVCIKCTFKGCNQMGYWASGSKTLGKNYLNTQDANEVPFCTHNYQVTLHSSRTKSSNQAFGIFKLRFSTKSSYGSIIDEAKTIFKSGNTSYHLASFNEYIQNDFQRIFLSYERTDNIFMSWFYEKKWAFEGIDVFDGELQKNYKFCPHGDGAVSADPVEFTRC